MNLIIVLFFVLLLGRVEAATYYVSTNGSGSTCSSLAPCAITMIQSNKAVAGDTWIINNGNYSNVYLNLDPSNGVNSGSGGGGYITVRAANERQAVLNTTANSDAMFRVRVSYWSFEGLVTKGSGNAISGTDGQWDIQNVDHVTFKRNVVFQGCTNCSATWNPFFTWHVDTLLLEENQFLRHAGAAVNLWDTDNVVLRRNYCNPRDWAIAATPAGLCFASYQSRNVILENNIAENAPIGLGMYSNRSRQNTKILGNITINGYLIAKSHSCYDQVDGLGIDDLVENHISFWNNPAQISSWPYTFWDRGNSNATYRNISSIVKTTGNFGAAFFGTEDLYIDAAETLSAPPCPRKPSFNITNMLTIANATSIGVFDVVASEWTTHGLTNVAYFNASTFSPNDGQITGKTPLAKDPLGACVIYNPTTSGQGATVVNAYIDGQQTTNPLWNFSLTGADRGQWIALGATASGITNVAGQSLQDVHQRLGFGNGTCASPGIAATYAFTQTHSQFYAYRDNTTTPVLKGTQDGSTTIQPNGTVRIRLKLSCTLLECPAISPTLYYSRNSGTYTAVLNSVGADSIAFTGTADTDPQIPSGVISTELLTSDFATNVNGAYVKTSGETPSIDLSLNSESENEYMIALSGAAVADTYDFRLYDGSGNPLNSYPATPRLTVVNAAIQVTGF